MSLQAYGLSAEYAIFDKLSQSAVVKALYEKQTRFKLTIQLHLRGVNCINP